MPRASTPVVIFLLATLSLSACSFGGSGSSKPQAPAPDAAAATTTDNTPPAPTAMDTFRALAPPEGLKFTPLFAEPAKDNDARMARLENAVQSLRNDFDTVVPSVVRLVAVEKDMKQLVGQLQTLTNGAPASPVEPVTQQSAAPQQPIPGGDAVGGTETAKADKAKAGTTVPTPLVTPEAAPKGELPPEGAASPNSKAAAPAPAPEKSSSATSERPSSTAGSVKDIRVGDHKDKTRVVFDLTAKQSYTATLTNNGKTLVIEMPNADLSSVKPFEASRGQLISGWHAEGQKIIIDLLYPSTIKAQSVLPPNGTPYNRLVVDLFSKDVHK